MKHATHCACASCATTHPDRHPEGAARYWRDAGPNPIQGTFGPAAFLAKLEEDAPERARQILDRVWIGKGNLTQGEAEWLDKQHPGDAWPVQKALAIAARDGNPPPKIAAKHFPPPPPTSTETP